VAVLLATSMIKGGGRVTLMLGFRLSGVRLRAARWEALATPVRIECEIVVDSAEAELRLDMLRLLTRFRHSTTSG
jgi:hypothetical protein